MGGPGAPPPPEDPQIREDEQRRREARRRQLELGRFQRNTASFSLQGPGVSSVGQPLVIN